MAGNISDYLENKLIDHSLGTSTYTKPTTAYLALFTTSPTDANTGTEVTTSGSAYVRQTITFSAASGGTTSNSSTVTFPTASSNWGTLTHAGIYDASTVGNLLWWGPLTVSKIVNTGDTFQVNAGALSISLD